MKLKLYRVYLDRPGCGWEEVVKATNVRAAIKKACKKHPYELGGDSIEAVKVPDDYLVKKAIVDGLKRERDMEINKLAKDYIHGVTALIDEYKVKIGNV